MSVLVWLLVRYVDPVEVLLLWGKSTYLLHTANSSTWGLSLKRMCIVLTPKRFPGYFRSVSALSSVVLLLRICNSRWWLLLLLSSSLQILYANEGESKKEPEFPEPLAIGEKSSYICHKGHEFIPTLYHFPTNCEACTKPLWNMFKPPPALECRRCHIKCHKDHMDKKEEIIAPCKGRSLHSQMSRFIDAASGCEQIEFSDIAMFLIKITKDYNCLSLHQWTMTCLRPRTCCCWPYPRRSSRSGWVDWSRRSPRSLHPQSTLHAPRHAPPWRSSPASPWGDPVDSSPPARAGSKADQRLCLSVFLFLDKSKSLRLNFH